jgi:FkbM family methyltransferase
MEKMKIFFIKIIFKFTRKILKILLIFVNKRLKLKILYWMYFFQEYKENELYNIEQIISLKGSAIDIGCNSGLWTYGLSKQKKINQILSFEPNKKKTKYIHAYNNNKIKIFHHALSNKNGVKILNIPIYKNIELDGWASLENIKDFKKKFFKFIKIKVTTRKLDSFNFRNISFVKIDVEGHELKLLEGARKFFEINKPNCIIEVNKKNLPKVKDFFQNLKVNYRYIPKNKFSFRFSKENFLFSIHHPENNKSV